VAHKIDTAGTILPSIKEITAAIKIKWRHTWQQNTINQVLVSFAALTFTGSSSTQWWSIQYYECELVYIALSLIQSQWTQLPTNAWAIFHTLKTNTNNTYRHRTVQNTSSTQHTEHSFCTVFPQMLTRNSIMLSLKFPKFE